MEKMDRLCVMVRRILIDNPEARDSDEKLISLFIKRYYPDRDIKLSELGYTSVAIPNLESVTRARRRVQAKDESLKGSPRARRRRKENEEAMRGWAVNG